MKRYLQISVVLLTLIAFAAVADADDFADAVQLYKSGDLEKAHQIFLIEAEKGNHKAQYNLGVMYINGWGTSQDFNEAFKWYRLTAEQGNADAQLTLGFMYVRGEGVLQSNEKAYAWCVIAAENGNETAKECINIEFAMQSMTRAQIEKGKQIAEEIVARLDNIVLHSGPFLSGTAGYFKKQVR